jgi:hypothetical protein
MNRKKMKRILLYVAGVLCSLMLLFFVLRSVVFSFYLHRRINGFNKEYHAQLKVENAKVRNLSDLLITGITLKPEAGDTLIKVDSVCATLNIWRTFFGRIVVHDLVLNKVRITLTQEDSVTNFSFLMGRKSTRSEDSLTKRNYASVFSKVTRAVFEKIPTNLTMTGLEVSYQKNGHKVMFQIDRFVTEHSSFHSSVRVTEGDTVKNWVVAGNLDNQEHSAGFRLYSPDKEKIKLPYIDYSLKAVVSFDTLTFRMAEEDKNDDLYHFRGLSFFKGLEVQQERISQKKVAFDRLGIDLAVNVGADFFEFDSTTQVFFNNLSFHPYFRYRPKPTKQVTFSIHKPDFPAEELFSSLPEGLFSSLNGIKVNGNLAFNLNFSVDLSVPDSLLFNCELKRNQFSVISYGNANLTRLNEPFEYTAYEKGVPARSFIVGTDNPEFRPLDKISHYLQISVLNSEDPGFYQHRGFIQDAFRESIILNIKERRFARGGSTISMQLVKNVFLNRNKTVARKLEEMLLTWLIENQQLCSKERMFEVYLNIIELGPHIYGANEAAHFYFKKEASKLNLGESIFLASIIPKPKWFMYSFDENGQIRQSEKDFCKLLSGKMLRKGQITDREYDKIDPDIELKGPAKLLLKIRLNPPDTLTEGDDLGY